MAAHDASSQSIDRFCRQYLQLERSLDFPDATILREEKVQSVLFQRVFADGALRHPPPPRYQLKALKTLTSKIEDSIEDWEQHGVSDDLMGRFSELVASPLPSEIAAAQQKAYVTYSLPILDSEDRSTSPSPFRARPSQITILETPNLVSAAGTTGLRTWEASLHLGQYLCSQPSLVKGKSVLELGAGTGYVSILCAKLLGAEHVIASDGSDEVVANLPENFYANELEGKDAVSVMDLKWGHALVGTEEEKWNGGKNIDLVLGADVTYDDTIIPPLVATLEELFGIFPEVKTLIAATERNQKTFDSFIRVCHQRHFELVEIQFDVPPRDKQVGPFYNDQVPIRICQISPG